MHAGARYRLAVQPHVAQRFVQRIELDRLRRGTHAQRDRFRSGDAAAGNVRNERDRVVDRDDILRQTAERAIEVERRGRRRPGRRRSRE
jgi:hypothetical protein